MKITVYTVSDCQFSQAEKEYLKAHNLPFEEKNLETNREYLTEMLAVSNNFAGTPVTKIEKDDGQIVVLKGFTKEEFDNVLGFVSTAAPQATSPTPSLSQSTTTSTPSPSPSTPPSPPPTTTPPQPTTQPTPSLTPQPTPTSSSSSPASPQPADPLASIINELEQKSNPPTPSSAQNQPPSPASSNLPKIPDFNG